MSKKVRPVVKTKKSFEELHMRMTTYIEKPLRESLEILKKQGKIKSYSRVMNKALKHYLKEKL